MEKRKNGFLARSLSLILLSVAFTAAPSFADSDHSNDPSARNWIYVGGNMGYSTLSTTVPGEIGTTGYQWNLKGLYSHYFDRWVVDFGGGFFLNHMQGDYISGGHVRIATQALLVELSPRYRISPRWQVGLVVNPLFGTDVSFDDNDAVDVAAFTLMAGARVEYETPGESSRWRFGLQAMKKLTATERNLWLVQADIQFGFPWASSPKEVEPQPQPAPLAAAPVARPAPSPRPNRAQIVQTSARSLKIMLPEAVLRFGTAKADLKEDAQALIREVSDYLAAHQGLWENLRVEGHSDKRGGRALNISLSRSRANAVAAVIRKSGIPRSKITTAGFGPDRLLNNGNSIEDHAVNRRVELHLINIKDVETITRELEAIADR